MCGDSMEKPDAKRVGARRKQLEAEVELLEGEIANAMHWQDYRNLKAALVRIRQLAKDIASELNLGDL
jgi:glutamyl-tRNA reductase